MELLNGVFRWAWTYKLSQWFWYRRGRQQEYVTQWARLRPGDRVLDIGCGPAAPRQWMPDVEYVGYDPNPHYIADARRRYPRNTQFVCGYLTELSAEQVGAFDLVLANGVMHHMSDGEVEQMLALAARALKPGGRLVTRDGCFEPEQNPVARSLLQWDRGKFVRTRDAYEALVRPYFRLQRVQIRRDMMRVPYSLILIEGVTRSRPVEATAPARVDSRHE